MKRRVWYRILSIWIASMAVWCAACSYVKASEAEADYVVTSIASDYAPEGGGGYFALTVKPSRKQVIEVEVRNNTDRNATVYTVFYTAGAGKDGTVNYIGPDEQADTVEIKLSDLITGESELVIPAGKSYVFQFTVNMPATGLNNPAAGGLVFLIAPERQEKNTEESVKPSQATEMGMQKPEEAGVIKLSANDDTMDPSEIIREGLMSWLQETDTAASVSAAFSYVVPIFLESGESVASPSLKLADISAADYENKIKAKIQNSTSISAEEVTIEATVRRKGKKEVFYEISEEHVSIPAHSIYELMIPSKGKEVDAGDYTLQIKLTIGNTEWEWQKDFIISDEEDNIIGNSETDSLEPNSKFSWGYVTIPVFVLFIVSVIVGILMYRKKQKEEEAILKVMKDIREII